MNKKCHFLHNELPGGYKNKTNSNNHITVFIYCRDHWMKKRERYKLMGWNKYCAFENYADEYVLHKRLSIDVIRTFFFFYRRWMLCFFFTFFFQSFLFSLLYINRKMLHSSVLRLPDICFPTFIHSMRCSLFTVMGTYPTIPQRWTCPLKTYSPSLARSEKTTSRFLRDIWQAENG